MIYLTCNPTLAVSGAKLFYFLGFGFLSPCVVVVVMHLISRHHVHCICIRVRLLHSSIFRVVRFAFRCFVLLRWSFLAFIRVWGLNISGLDRDLPSGLGLLPVDRLSSFVPFGLCLMPPTVNRGTEKASCVLHPNTPPIWPKTQQNHLHQLEHSITIAWPKTSPHLDSPSSLYAYKYTPLRNSRFLSSKP